MREILFRGKTSSGKWIVGVFYRDSEGIFIITKLEITLAKRGRSYIVGLEEIIPETVGQYIGRDDCNDQKLFDGDIILIDGKYPKIIKWGDDCACFLTANIDSIKHKDWMDIWTQPSKCWWKEFGREIEVIGNIYDNPELMED